jgi:DNA adenine methylase
LPHILDYWDKRHQRFVEPFMGSACFFFALRPRFALLGDINRNLVETFVSVRNHPRAVSNHLSQLPLGRTSYAEIRKLNPDCIDPIARAARFIFLNRFCFNGLYRTNGKGEFNVPFAPNGTGNLPSFAELKAASDALKRATIKCSDFSTILDQTRKGDFVYLDPPYAVENRRVFRQYDPASFGIADLERLSDAMRAMNKRGVHFVVSYAYCPEAIRAFEGWAFRRVLVQRNISGFAENRRRAAEVIVSNIMC